jgi:hypothetical protein
MNEGFVISTDNGGIDEVCFIPPTMASTPIDALKLWHTKIGPARNVVAWERRQQFWTWFALSMEDRKVFLS